MLTSAQDTLTLMVSIGSIEAGTLSRREFLTAFEHNWEELLRLGLAVYRCHADHQILPPEKAIARLEIYQASLKTRQQLQQSLLAQYRPEPEPQMRSRTQQRYEEMRAELHRRASRIA